MLAGRQTHGIRRLERFTPQMARERAHQGWLTDKQYLAIILNPDLYNELFRDTMGQDMAALQSGNEEVFFMCPKELNDQFEYTLTETEDVRIDNLHFMTLTRSYTPTFEKREYTLHGACAQKIVHYGPNIDRSRQDKAKAVIRAGQLGTTMENYEATSKANEDEILDRILH